ncbi:hypothetical protein APASM_3033 [Actinosynnema pretiosum subsp. pretiosum]|nr:hypothetical protein APASM_3033 [Actinosynnema pretiosum subsp. pretiosum]
MIKLGAPGPPAQCGRSRRACGDTRGAANAWRMRFARRFGLSLGLPCVT